MKVQGLSWIVLLALMGSVHAANLDESPAEPGEWGYHPADGAVSATNPPSFTWRLQNGLTWQFQVALDADFDPVIYSADELELPVHCPPKVFSPRKYCWRYRGRTDGGEHTQWSRVRRFTVPQDAARMPMPPRDELLRRIPDTHPRLFVRPEKMPRLRELAKGPMQEKYQDLVRECERILADPPPTAEPPKYPAGMERGSDAWRQIWWGNRTYTIRTLNSAATLAFTRLLGGPERYGREAQRILLECAAWDPKGSTGYRYNDEAGMPYNYYFSRTYSFVNDLLSEEERQMCRKVMTIRGREMYDHLCPRHLWRPYGSHANRAWHFLGEVAIAFHGEIPEASDWLWFAMNVFYNVYPVWSDADGGWHEGSSYWSSYQLRFTWWADIMREAMGIDAFDKPYYSRVGYYPMYLLPPGKVGGGFGDLTARKQSRNFREIMTIFAAQAQNPHWQWYVEQIGGPVEFDGYIGFVRGTLPEVQAEPPGELPGSRLFEGIGQAMLNTQITDADDSVQIVFKSSPFGTQSHGYEANNSFLLWAYGQRMLIRSGYRDQYGSAHHRNWMWSTRSVNNITVNGKGQGKRTAGARGRIVAFQTTPEMDLVVGECGDAYEEPLEEFTRAIVFVKPDLMIVYDRLVAPEPSTYEYWLHAIEKMDVDGQHDITVGNGDVLCKVDFLTPTGLAFEQTDQYDPNPRPRITLREWHLTAKTADKRDRIEFVTLYRIGKAGGQWPRKADLRSADGGYVLKAAVRDGDVLALLPSEDNAKFSAEGLSTTGEIAVRLNSTSGPAKVVRSTD